MSQKPWHDTETCPECALPVVVPFYSVPPRDVPPGGSVRHVRCAACGKDWIEDDDAKLARIWWSQGAEDGRCEQERSE
jgi:hypothetical protein